MLIFSIDVCKCPLPNKWNSCFLIPDEIFKKKIPGTVGISTIRPWTIASSISCDVSTRLKNSLIGRKTANKQLQMQSLKGHISSTYSMFMSYKYRMISKDNKWLNVPLSKCCCQRHNNYLKTRVSMTPLYQLPGTCFIRYKVILYIIISSWGTVYPEPKPIVYHYRYQGCWLVNNLYAPMSWH